MSTFTFPSTFEMLTPEWMNEILRDAGYLSSSRIISFSLETIGEGSGFIGQIAKLKFNFDNVPELYFPKSVVVKISSMHEGARNLAKQRDFYRRECRFYQEIASHSNIRVPQIYFSAVNSDGSEFIIVMEDLTSLRVGDALSGCESGDIGDVMEQLAKFHATWWNADLVERFDWITDFKTNVDVLNQIYLHSLNKIGHMLPESLRELGNRMDYKAVRERLFNSPQTIIHGDCRADNILFASRESGEPLVIVDWQVFSQGPGVFDIAYFFNNSVQVDLLESNEISFLKKYHSELEKQGVSNYDFNQCLSDYRLSIADCFAKLVIILGTLNVEGIPRGIQLRDALIERTEHAVLRQNVLEII